MDLLSAVKHGDQSAVTALLKSGVDVNDRDTHGTTALSEAAERGHKKIVKLLLEQQSIDLNSKNNYGQTPLSVAAEMGHNAVVELLLAKNGIDPNTKVNSKDGRTILSWAAGNGNVPIVQLLLTKDDIDPNSRDKDGHTPLSVAAKGGHNTVVGLLLAKNGIDPNCRVNSRDGRTILSWAAQNGDVAIVKLLLTKDDIDLNSKDNANQTPLSRAVESGHKAVVELLLARNGIDLDSKDNHDLTTLSCVEVMGHETVVKYLIAKDVVDPDSKHTVDPGSKDNNGQTPLSRAAETGHEAAVELFLAKDDIDRNSSKNDSQTPLLRAVKNEQKTAASLPADGDVPGTYDGGTPLSWAAENGHETVVKLILEGDDISPNCNRNDGRTPLSLAAESGHMSMVELLLEQGIDPNSKDNDGQTPLSRAAERGHMAVVKLLTPHDTVTLHMLAQEGKLGLVNLIINAHYDVLTTDDLGRTALHIATAFGHFEIARALISAGANVDAEDKNGATPLRCAIRHKRQDLIEVLLKSSAHVKDIMADEWLDAYGKDPKRIVLSLSEEAGGKKWLRFIEGIPDQSLSEPGVQRRLLLFANYSAWIQSLTPDLRNTPGADKSQIFYREQIHDSDVRFSVAVWLPLEHVLENQMYPDTSKWAECGIAWTMTPPATHEDGSRWKSRDHFSMLPNGWIPDDGIDFFQQFFVNLKKRWIEQFNRVEDHLSHRRIQQLKEKGLNSDFLYHLTEDARKLAELRGFVRGQVRSARKIAVDYCLRYNEGEHRKTILMIDGFSDDVEVLINHLDQTIRDILQLEFAWVSINKAHTPTSITTSMKRLSWITFIFLPAIFASSLFGMNVDILQDNPDWRWYLLFGGGTLILTAVGWLIFKYAQVERWLDTHVGTHIERWAMSKSRPGLPM